MRYIIITLLLITLSPHIANAELFGFVSDIHAGSQKIRKGKQGKPNEKPSQAIKTLRKYIKAMQNQGVDMIISAGDNTNNRDNKYAKKMIKFPVVWAVGNHDSPKSVLAPQRYYTKETPNFRIIILDSNYGVINKEGEIPKWEQDWLYEQLKTEKKIIIVMHHPPMSYLKDIIRGSNVKAVFSGHMHIESQYIEDGIRYVILPPIVKGFRTFNL